MRGLFALAAAVVALVAVPAAHEASPAGSKILYESYSDGDYDIYAVDPETHAVLKLTDNTFEDSLPTPSPDGTQVAYYSASGTAVENTDGTDRHDLTGCVGYNLSWAPDGTRIVCENADGGISIARADGSGATVLVSKEASAPSWSPDGASIAYVGVDGVYTVAPNGSDVRHLTSHPADYLTVPSWSPDSKSIVFVSDEGSALRSDLYLVSADDSAFRRLDKNIFEERPRWSPDGSVIAYTTKSNGALAVFTIAPDGTGKSLVAAGTHGEGVYSPSWSPDGSELAYIRGRFPGYSVEGDVFAVSRDGVRREITFPFPSSGSASSPSWTAGTLQNGTPPPDVHPIALPKKTQVGGTSVLAAAIGSGSTVTAPAQSECAPFLVWQLGKRARMVNPCRDVDLLLQIAVAGKQVAWATAIESHTEFPQYLQVSDEGRNPVTVSSAEADPETGAGDFLYQMAGDGDVLAFNFWHEKRGGRVTRLTTWRIVPDGFRGAVKCPASKGEVAPGVSKRRCLALRAGNGMNLLSVSGGRIVGVKGARLVRVLDATGHLVRSQRVSAPVLGAQMQGSKLVVLTASQLLVFAKGRQVAHYPLAQGPDLPDPKLLHGSGNLALYSRGAVHVVRLSDGRDRALSAGGQGPPVDAQLGKRGLFYEYNQLYTRKPGRVLFVPRGRLQSLVKAG